MIGYPQAGRDLPQRGGDVCARTDSRRLPQAVCCRTTPCSTTSATSHRAQISRRCTSSPASRWAFSICEDAWSPTGPDLAQAAGGAEVIVNLNGSPYYAGRLAERETMLATWAADALVPIVYANLVGGRTARLRRHVARVRRARPTDRHAKQFAEDLLVVDLDVRPTFRKRLLDPRGRARTAVLPEVVGARRIRPRRPRRAGPPRPAQGSRHCRPNTRCTKRSCSAPATTC